MSNARLLHVRVEKKGGKAWVQAAASQPANLSTDDGTINGGRRMTNEKERRTERTCDGLRTNRSSPDCLTAVTVTTD